jgi:hypothetical protein
VTRPVDAVDQLIDGHDLAVELAFALKLATAADLVTLPHYEQRSYTLDWKANRTEVTEADRESELAISDLVLAERPTHGLYGEEHGVVGDADSPWRWIIDPIDGTSNFVRGIPVWASLIALTHVDHGPLVGVVSAPGARSPMVGRTRPGRRGHHGHRWRPALPGVVGRLDRRRTGVGHVRPRGGTTSGSPVSWWRCSSGRTVLAGSATSGSTCSWPRAPSTSPSTRWG